MSLDTLYFLGISLGGGLLAVFFSAGWGSFKEKKIPERHMLFRWFLAGLVACGLAAYAWIFGSGGNVGEAVKKLTGALDIESITTIVSGGAAIAAAATEKEPQEMTVGMPSF